LNHEFSGDSHPAVATDATGSEGHAAAERRESGDAPSLQGEASGSSAEARASQGEAGEPREARQTRTPYNRRRGGRSGRWPAAGGAADPEPLPI